MQIFNTQKFNLQMQANHPKTSSVTKTRLQIANEYGVHVRTFSRWLLKHDIQLPAGNITPKYQKIIYDALGKP